MTTFSDYLQKLKFSHFSAISLCELRKRCSFYNEMSKTHESKTFLDKKEIALEIIAFDDDNEKDSLYSSFSYEELKGIKRSYNENSKILLKEVPELCL